MQVLIDGLLIIKVGIFQITELFALFAVQDVRFGNGIVAAAGEHGFHAVLNILHGNIAVFDLGQKVR